MPEGTPDPFADPTAAITDLQERLDALEAKVQPAGVEAVIAELAISRLHLAPGEVLVLRAPGFDAEEAARASDIISLVLADAGLDNRVLVISADVELDVVSGNLVTLTQEDISKAGADGWSYTAQDCGCQHYCEHRATICPRAPQAAHTVQP